MATFGGHRAVKHGAAVLAAGQVQATRIAAAAQPVPVVGTVSSPGDPPGPSAASVTASRAG
jgi:hypothetical protein